jgi:hypothetical protein
MVGQDCITVVCIELTCNNSIPDIQLLHPTCQDTQYLVRLTKSRFSTCTHAHSAQWTKHEALRAPHSTHHGTSALTPGFGRSRRPSPNSSSALASASCRVTRSCGASRRCAAASLTRSHARRGRRSTEEGRRRDADRGGAGGAVGAAPTGAAPPKRGRKRAIHRAARAGTS